MKFLKKRDTKMLILQIKKSQWSSNLFANLQILECFPDRPKLPVQTICRQFSDNLQTAFVCEWIQKKKKKIEILKEMVVRSIGASVWLNCTRNLKMS
jgi:hypothetical protein